MGKKLNAPAISVRNEINLTLPIIVGGMTGNALNDSKIMLLYQALTADHNGSIFDNLNRFFSATIFIRKVAYWHTSWEIGRAS
ncbi:MAG: DUF937 domain-containing protein [Cyclobacteriaceae bacterium]